jgi:hypothetical protein
MTLSAARTKPRPVSLKRTLRAIAVQRSAIDRSMRRLCQLRADLEYIEGMCEGARHDLQSAINSLSEIERLTTTNRRNTQ